MDTQDGLEYVGFWARVGAAIIDAVLLLLVTAPPLTAIYGSAYWLGDGPLIHGFADLLISWVLPAAATVAFWLWKRATPGKLIIGAEIVDARTGAAPTLGQAIGRYLGYFVSLVALLLGYLWVGFDPRKQGWHDKLAGTVVVRRRRRVEPVRFSGV